MTIAPADQSSVPSASNASRTAPAASPSDEGGADAVTSFNLYFAAGTISSNLALANLRMICEKYDLGTCRITEINILREPLRALSDGILITPTLVRNSPLPRVTIVGDLSNTQAVLLALGLDLGRLRQ